MLEHDGLILLKVLLFVAVCLVVGTVVLRALIVNSVRYKTPQDVLDFKRKNKVTNASEPELMFRVFSLGHGDETRYIVVDVVRSTKNAFIAGTDRWGTGRIFKYDNHLGSNLLVFDNEFEALTLAEVEREAIRYARNSAEQGKTLEERLSSKISDIGK